MLRERVERALTRRRRSGDIDFDLVERFIMEYEPHRRVSTFNRGAAHRRMIDDAARRLGMEVERDEGLSTYLIDGQIVGGVAGMLPGTTTLFADRVCRSKIRTKEALEAAGVPVPPGRRFGLDEFRSGLKFAKKIGWPVAVKPDAFRAGKGISTGVTGRDAFQQAWQVAESARDGERKPTSVVVERHVRGLDVRVIVVAGKAVSATARVLPHVVGDGVSTIEELVAAKNELRLCNDYLSEKPIVIEQAVLTRAGRTSATVPGDGEVAFVGGRGNIHAGADNVDVTDEISPDLLRITVDAAGAIPGLEVAGVDLLTPSLRSTDGAVVLEMNTRANIRMHHQPWAGEPRDVAIEIAAHLAGTGPVPGVRAP